jgi:Replication-relaxation
LSRSPASLLDRITDRDIGILRDVIDHGWLTTEHICGLHWGDPKSRVGRRRLQELGNGSAARGDPGMKVLHDARPPASVGLRGQNVYSATPLGYDVAGVDRARRGVVVNPKSLRHRVASADFRTVLTLACADLTPPKAWRVALWLAERACRNQWGEGTLVGAGQASGIVPDGFGIVEGPGFELSFALEVDQGNEIAAVLRDKFRRYDKVPDIETILFLCVDAATVDRVLEASAPCRSKRVLAALRAEALADPLGPVWRTQGDRRVALLDL